MKKPGFKGKLEELSYQVTAKKGNMPVILKSIRELDTTLSKIGKGKKK